jgi:hypothetical protein
MKEPMKVLDTIFIETVLLGVCQKLDLPLDTPLLRFGKRIVAFVLDEAERLQDNALKSGSISILRRYGHPLTLENYLAFHGMTEEDVCGEMWEVIPDLFNPAAVEGRVQEIMDRIEVENFKDGGDIWLS